MEKTDILAQLRGFIEQEFPAQGAELTDKTDLLDEWFVDSLGIVETVLFIETNFGIEVSRADIVGENFQNLAALSDFVSTRLAA